MFISVRISRGWFDAGLPPMRKNKSAFSTSSRLTVAVPVPSDCSQTDAAGLMAVIGAVVDEIGAVNPREELEEKAGFVRRSATNVKEVLVGRCRTQLIGDAANRLVPTDDLVMGIAWAGEKGLDQPAAPFQFARREPLKLGNGIALEKVRSQPPLHVGDHRLERLLANLRPVAQFVAHAAGLSAHAQRAGLAGVLGPHRFPKLSPADPVGHSQRVTNGRPTAAALHRNHFETRKQRRSKSAFFRRII